MYTLLNLAEVGVIFPMIVLLIAAKLANPADSVVPIDKALAILIFPTNKFAKKLLLIEPSVSPVSVVK